MTSLWAQRRAAMGAALTVRRSRALAGRLTPLAGAQRSGEVAERRGWGGGIHGEDDAGGGQERRVTNGGFLGWILKGSCINIYIYIFK